MPGWHGTAIQDVLPAIFARLEFHERVRLSEVCRAWRDVLAGPGEAWQNVVLARRAGKQMDTPADRLNWEGALPWLRRRTGRVRRLFIGDFVPRPQAALHEAGPALTDLRVGFELNRNCDGDCVKQLTEATGLRHLELDFYDSPDEAVDKAWVTVAPHLARWTRLTVLMLTLPESAASIPEPLWALTSLRWLALDAVSVSELPAAAAALTQLRRLDLVSAGQCPDGLVLGPGLPLLTQLRRVSLRSCSLRMAGEEHVWLPDLSGLTALTRLEVAWARCANFRGPGLGDSVPDLGSAAPALRSLAYTNGQLADVGSPLQPDDSVLRLRGLRSLHINFLDFEAYALLRELPQLRALVLDGCLAEHEEEELDGVGAVTQLRKLAIHAAIPDTCAANILLPASLPALQQLHTLAIYAGGLRVPRYLGDMMRRMPRLSRVYLAKCTLLGQTSVRSYKTWCADVERRRLPYRSFIMHVSKRSLYNLVQQQFGFDLSGGAMPTLCGRKRPW